MLRGHNQHIRSTIYSQAALVWCYQKVHARSYIEDGATSIRGEPISLEPEQEAKVSEYMERIEKAGRFVMPEEIV